MNNYDAHDFAERALTMLQEAEKQRSDFTPVTADEIEARVRTLAILAQTGALHDIAEHLRYQQIIASQNREVITQLEDLNQNLASVAEQLAELNDIHLTALNEGLLDVRAELDRLTDATADLAERPLLRRRRLPLAAAARVRATTAVPKPLPTPHDAPDAELTRVGF